MVIKVFFAVLVLSTAAVVAVILAIHFRVKRHLRDGPEPASIPAANSVEAQESPPAAGSSAELIEDVDERARR